MTLLVIVPSLVCLAATAVLLYGLRGRRVDDHPTCGKCGFDLIGKPAGSRVCSECGADLTGPRAVRVGRRERRRGLTAVAAPVLVGGLAWIGFVGWRASRDTNWNRHKPVWWLMREAGGSRVAPRDAAFAELADRMTSGKLTPEREAALIDAALELQADRRRPWTATVGDVIARASDAGKLSNEKWQRYAWQAAPLELVARPVVRRGDPVVFSIVIPPSRLADGHSFRFEYKIADARVGDVVASAPGVVRGGGGELLFAGAGAAQTMFEMPEAGNTLRALREGLHTLRLSARLEMYDGSGPRRPRNPPLGPPMQFDQTREFSAQVRVVPRDTVTVGTVFDESLRPAVEKSVRAGFTGESGGYCDVVVEADKPPIDLAFTIVARHWEREWRVGDGHLKAGQSGRSFAALKLLTGLPEFAPSPEGGQWESARFDLILRPSVEEAVRTLDITRIWGGEIVFKDVRLQRGPNTYRPAAPGDVATTEPPASLLAP